MYDIRQTGNTTHDADGMVSFVFVEGFLLETARPI